MNASVHAPADLRALVRNTVRVCILILAAIGLVGSVLTIVFYLQGAPGGGTLSAGFERTVGDGRQHSVVTHVDPGSPLIAQGVKAGDAVQFDHALDDGFLYRRFAAGESIGITVLGPRPRHVVVKAVPEATEKHFADLTILDNVTSILSLTIGALIVLRSRRSTSLVALGTAFIMWADFSTVIPQNQTPVGFFWYELGLNATQGFVATTALLLFSILFYRENSGRLHRTTWPLFWTYVAVFAAVTVATCALNLYNYALPFLSNAGTLNLGLVDAGLAAAFLVLVIGWRRSRQELQRRYAIMTVAISLVITCDLIFAFSFLISSGFANPDYRLLYTIGEWISAAGHLLFAYAVLRDKVIDLGFVINRAVVYGVISALLLVAFGLIEWAIEHFIPIESREKSALLDAAIALGLYLVFHRIKDAVERFIEKLFFHKWHANEQQLRRFVREADFITEPQALMSAFITEVRRFAQGAAAEICLRQESGDFGTDGQAVAANDPAVVALRARRTAIDPAASASSLNAALLLPLSHRGDVFGAVVLGPRPDGASYRPDEIDVLTWATHQIGLDYHALRVEALESEAAALREQNVALSGVIGKALAQQSAILT